METKPHLLLHTLSQSNNLFLLRRISNRHQMPILTHARSLCLHPVLLTRRQFVSPFNFLRILLNRLFTDRRVLRHTVSIIPLFSTPEADRGTGGALALGVVVWLALDPVDEREGVVVGPAPAAVLRAVLFETDPDLVLPAFGDFVDHVLLFSVLDRGEVTAILGAISFSVIPAHRLIDNSEFDVHTRLTGESLRRGWLAVLHDLADIVASLRTASLFPPSAPLVFHHGAPIFFRFDGLYLLHVALEEVVEEVVRVVVPQILG